MTTAAHRKALKKLRTEAHDARELALYWQKTAERAQAQTEQARATNAGFRNGVEFVVRMMVRELVEGRHPPIGS